MQIQIDSREQSRIQSAKDYYTKQGLDVEVCQLEIGDYIFDNKVSFEFKTIPDFIASIQNGKIFNQAINMAENYDYHYVIIQGDEHTRSRALGMSRNYIPINISQYLGAIASLNRFTTVIESYNPIVDEASYRMLTTATKAIQTKPIVKKFPRKHKNPAFNYLAYCIYGINAKRAQDIVYSCHLQTLEDLFNLTHQDLIKIDGIGDNLADKILQSISEDTYES